MPSDLLKQISLTDPRYQDLPEDAVAQLLYKDYGEGQSERDFYGKLGYEPPGMGEEFARGVKRNIDTTGALVTKGMPAAVLSLLGFEEASQKFALEYAAAEQEAATTNPTGVPTYKDVDDIGEAAALVGRYAGEGLGSLIQMGVGALMGGGAGGVLATGYAKAQAKLVAKDLADEAIKQSIKKGIVSKAIKIGAKTGAAGTGVAANTGESYINLLDQGEDAPGVAILAGGVKGMLDYAPVAGAFKRLFPSNLEDKALTAVTEKGLNAALKNVGKEGIKLGWQEGLTEASQEAIDIAAEQFVIENAQMFTQQNADRLIEAGLAGAVGGGFSGGLFGAVGSATAQIQDIKPNIQELESEVTDLSPEALVKVFPEGGDRELTQDTIKQSADIETQRGAEFRAKTDDVMRRNIGAGPNLESGYLALALGVQPDVDLVEQAVTKFNEQRVFHGTSNTFDQFSTENLGTGQGAQAFGWGLYFTDQKEVAQFYSQSTSTFAQPEAVLLDGKPVNVDDFNPETPQGHALKFYTEFGKGMDKDQYANELENPLFNNDPEYVQFSKEAAQWLRDNDVQVIEKEPRIYEAEIPEDTDFLDWAIPLQDQPPQIVEALAKNPETAAYLEQPFTAADMYFRMAREKQSPRAVSEMLSDMGVAGIRYPAKFYSGERTHQGGTNYVVFDDKAIEMVQERQAAQSLGIPEQAQTTALSNDPKLWDYAESQLRAMRPKDMAKYESVVKQVKQAVKQVAGPNVNVEFFDTLYRFDEDGNIANPLRGVQFGETVSIALGMNDTLDYSNLETGMHEAFHFMYDNVLSDSDKRILTNAKSEMQDYVIKKYQDKYGIELTKQDVEVFDAEENSATAFGLYAEDFLRKQPNNPILKKANAVFRKMMRILRRIGDTLRGNNIYRFEDLFEDVISGERKPSDSLALASNAMRVARAQRAIEYARDSRQRRIIDDMHNVIPRSKLINDIDNLAKQTRTKLEDTDGVKQLAKLQFNGRFLNSMPGLASKYPVMAPFVNHLVRKAEDLKNIETHFNKTLAPILENRKTFLNASAILDHLRQTEQDLQQDPADGRLVYKRGDKTVKAPKDVSDSVIALREALSDVLRLQRKFIRNNLEELGYDPNVNLRNEIDELKAKYRALIDEGAEPSKITNVNNNIKNLEGVQSMLAELDTLLSSSKVYFPQMRFGDFGVSVMDAENNLVAFYMIESDITGGYNKKQYSDVLKQIKEKGDDTKDFKVYGGKKDPITLTRRNLTEQLKIPNRALTMELLASLITSSTDDIYADVTQADKMMKDAADMVNTNIAARGFERHFINARNIDGYSQDYDRVIPAYFSAFTRFLNNQRYSVADNTLRAKAIDTQTGSPALNKFIRDYVEYGLSPRQDHAGLRLFSFMYALGGNISTALLQLVTLPTMTAAEIMQWKGNPISANANIAKSLGDAFRVLSTDVEKLEDINHLKKVLKDDDEATALHKAVTLGKVRPGMTDDYINGAASGTYGVNGNVVRVGRWLGNSVLARPIQFTEEASRIASFLSIYRSLKTERAQNIAREVYKNDPRFKDALDNTDLDFRTMMAMYGVDEVHAIFGKEGRNYNQRGIWGSLIFPFMTYPMQTMELMGRMLTQRGGRGRTALTYSLVSFMLMGGLMGLPGSELAKELMEKLFQIAKGREIDINTEIKKALVSSEMFSPKTAEAIVDGNIRAFAGADVSRRIALPFFWQNALIPFLQGQSEIDQFLGVQGSLIRNTTTASKNMITGDWSPTDAVFESLMPIAFKNMYEATVMYPNKGMRTKSTGTQLVRPEDFSSKDLALKAIGIQPAQISRQYERNNAIRISSTGYRQGRNKHVRRIVNQLDDITKARKEGASKETLAAMREDLSDLYREFVQFSVDAGLIIDKTFWDGVNRSIDGQLINRRNPDAITRANRNVNYGEINALFDIE